VRLRLFATAPGFIGLLAFMVQLILALLKTLLGLNGPLF
jgi:hypothetical protein